MLAGIVVQPGLLTSLPGEAKAFQREFFDRVFALPFVPLAWANDVRAHLAASPNDMLRIEPGANLVFIDTPEKVKAWSMLARLQQDTLHKIFTNWGSIVRVAWEADMRSTERWNAIRDTAISVATTVRDLPQTVVSAAGNVASGAALAGLVAFLPVILIAGLGIVAFVWGRRQLREG